MLKLERVHQDKRGEIYSLMDKSWLANIVLLITEQGCARGGCVHKESDEYVTVLGGRIKFYIEGMEPRILKKGDNIIVPCGKPHYFVSLTSSLVIEWGITFLDKGKYNKSFRNIVNKINEENNTAN